ncbi:MAG: hypothetical protein IPK70_08965 [Flavobacteriales bacterium]|jgi:hypothetical protein|nr:hypothetical protein [Flavobacteriales bacterium]
MQATAQGFVNTYGGALADDAVGVSLGSSGFHVATRRFAGQGNEYQAGLLQLGTSGSEQSWLPISIDGRSSSHAMALGTNGSAFIAGSSFAPGRSDHDGFVAKLDPNGAMIWLTRPSLAGDQQYLAVHGLPDGGCIAAGVRGIGDGHDAWITRLNAFGLVQWHQSVTDFSDVEAHGITVQGDDVMLTGRQLNFGGSTDAWIARLSLMNGDLVWSSSWGGVRNEIGRAIAAIGPGAFVLAGTTNSEVPYDFSEGRHKDHLYLVAFDLNGDSLWTRAIGDTLCDRRCFGLASAPNGDLLACGEHSVSLGSTDAWAVRLTPDGALIWERAWDLGKEERLLALSALPDGFIAAGWSFGAASRQALVVRKDPNGF